MVPLALVLAAPLLTQTSTSEAARPDVLRSEHRVPTAEGGHVFVRRVRPRGPSRGAVVLTHGAGSPASAVWDLPFGYSVMAALARRGLEAYSVDVRGFGGSTLPAALRGSPEGEPAVRAQDVMPDVAAAMRFARKRSGHAQADLVGWSWGCVVAGLYASQHPEEVGRMVLFAPVYDRRWPRRHRTEGVWRSEARALHMKWLDPAKEEPRVREAYVAALFRFVPSGTDLILPNGPYRDVYGPDAPVWTATVVRAPTLVVRGSEDRASLRAPALRLFEALASSERAYLELAGAGHFAFRTRRAPELRRAIVSFLAD